MSSVVKKISFVLLLLLFACVPVDPNMKTGKNQQAEARYKMALAHLQGGNATMALRELLVAVKQDPQNSAIQEALARTYQRKKAYALAEKHYILAIRLSDNKADYHNNLAALYLDMKQWDEAIHHFDKAAHDLLFANAHVAFTGKAYAYFMKKDYPAAISSCEEVEDIAPRYARVYFLKSKIYDAMNNVERQEMSLRRTVELAPQFMDARYQLATLLVKNNSFSEAKEQLGVILEFSPTSEVGYKAKKLLQSL